MSEKTITLKTSEGLLILMPEKYARRCITLRNLLDDIDEAEVGVIPVPISKFVLTKIIEFCTKYEDDHIKELESKELESKELESKELEWRINPLEGWNKDFVSVSHEILFEMIKGANYIDLKQMLDICCKSIADQIKGQSPTEIKKIFGIEGDFTQEEKQSVIDENPWLEPNVSMDTSIDTSIITPSESSGGSIGESIILPPF